MQHKFGITAAPLSNVTTFFSTVFTRCTDMMKTLRSQVLESADYLSANLENEFSSLNADVYGEDESPKKKEFFSDLESSSLDTSFNQVRMEFYLAVYNHCLFKSRLE